MENMNVYKRIVCMRKTSLSDFRKVYVTNNTFALDLFILQKLNVLYIKRRSSGDSNFLYQMDLLNVAAFVYGVGPMSVGER